MIKNRCIQLVGRAIILAIMVAGTIFSIGISEPNPNFYVYYTNLSNYLCMLVVFLEIIFTISKIGKNETKGLGDVSPAIKFAVLIDIFVTFLVFNILLVDTGSNLFTAKYWDSLTNIMFHFTCPLLFLLDWALFAKHGNTRWYYPLAVLIFPLIYVAFILIRGYIIAGTAEAWQIVYPYFFLDVDLIGYTGVLFWVLGLIAFFLILSYLLYFLDNIGNIVKHAKAKKQVKLAKASASNAELNSPDNQTEKQAKTGGQTEKQTKADEQKVLTKNESEKKSAKKEKTKQAKAEKANAKKAKKQEKASKAESKKADKAKKNSKATNSDKD